MPFSGPLALQLAAESPPGLLGVPLVATFITPPVRLPALLAKWLVPLMFRMPPPMFLLSRLLIGSDADAPLRQQLARAVRAVHPKVMARRALEILAVDARAALAQCSVPIIYLTAKRDRLVPPRSVAPRGPAPAARPPLRHTSCSSALRLRLQWSCVGSSPAS